MYPRVKVREQEQDDSFSPEDDSSSLLLLKVFESLSVQDCCSPEKGNENDSPPLVTKIPKTRVPNLAMPLNSVSKGASQLPETKKNNKHVVDDAKPNARASSIPRPRAVVSSPDNDGMIGNMNKLISRRPLTLEKQHPIKKSPDQAKVNPGQGSSRKSSEKENWLEGGS
ncbi:hypothetical protein L1049_003767 [Liquidambar formosana]|uniref:Uncharacterized protein n=1 Tax=Liquidambar formosana TaxID=63359 RepID=A0AAP0RSQ3_LIQFO